MSDFNLADPVPSSDYCEYFFLRTRAGGGAVMTHDTTYPFLRRKG